MGHGALADVAVHAVPSDLTEDDLKITATVAEGPSLTEEELFRWCIDRAALLRAAPLHRVRAELPRSPVGRVLKRELRADGVTGPRRGTPRPPASSYEAALTPATANTSSTH